MSVTKSEGIQLLNSRVEMNEGRFSCARVRLVLMSGKFGM